MSRPGGFWPDKYTFARARQSGFTLLEILVVVSIIALLVAILVPALRGARNEAQSAHCLSNLKQVSNGLQIHLLDAGMRRERISTNFGWATYSFKANKGAGKLFSCPTDPDPLPVPALFADIYEGTSFRGRAASDGVFNTVKPSPNDASQYLLDIQDSVNEDWFGRDAGTGDHDLLMSYTPLKGAPSAHVSVEGVHSNWTFRVFDYKGRTIWDSPSASAPRQLVPLMWLSYGANAAAGFRNTKGNPILIVENKNVGCFAEDYSKRKRTGATPKSGGRRADVLRQTLRFRHGGVLRNKSFVDRFDPSYVAREQINTAFLDGHAERLRHNQIVGPDPQTDSQTGELLWHRNLWLGIRRGTENWFD